MGPSGSGKSTLLAVLSGRSSYGRVGGRLLVAGKASDDLRLLKHVTGFVPQDDILHGELTAEENIYFQAALRLPVDTSFKDIGRRVAATARDLNLTGVLQSRVGTQEKRGVSGGQRKRVSIAMELVAQPLLLFADEPTSGLDSTTAHEVVNCLNTAAARLGTTVFAVIHQPRYDTLRLFDELVLLSQGELVYAAETAKAVAYFKELMHVDFPLNTNPADIMLDVIQLPRESEVSFAQVWKSRHGTQDLTTEVAQSAALRRFSRETLPLVRSITIYMDRSLRQSMCAWPTILVNQVLNIGATLVLCTVLRYDRLDQFIMQSAFACLFLMLLQGVAAQRIFGNDLLLTWREARVGMPMVAYFVAKDLAALFEITISSVAFTAAYGSFSGCQLSLGTLFAGTWAYVYSVFGLSYIFSILLSPGAAQMSAVVASFIAFCVSGVYQPQLPEITGYMDGRGWMVPALSPLRWLWAYLLTAESHYLTPVTRMAMSGSLAGKGYKLHYLACPDVGDVTLKDAWLHGRCWVCSVGPMLLLGVLFRFLAGLCLIVTVSAQTSGWTRFLARSEAGAWKLFGRLFVSLFITFLVLFLLSEVWVFSLLELNKALIERWWREERRRPIPSPILTASFGDREFSI